MTPLTPTVAPLLPHRLFVDRDAGSVETYLLETRQLPFGVVTSP